MARHHDLGDLFALRASILPQNATAATYTGPSFDRMPANVDHSGNFAMIAFGANGAASGTPDSYTVTWTIQDSDVGTPSADDWASYATLPTATANNTLRSANVNLEPARRYVRMVSVVTFVNGTTPAVPIVGGFAFGSSSSGDTPLYQS